MVLLGMWSWDGIVFCGEDVFLSGMCLGINGFVFCFLTIMVVRCLSASGFDYLFTEGSTTPCLDSVVENKCEYKPSESGSFFDVGIVVSGQPEAFMSHDDDEKNEKSMPIFIMASYSASNSSSSIIKAGL